MKQKSYMTISEFARISGIKRANLIFYDKVGLLSPEFRGENEYRYYSRHQLSSAYLITALRELGLGLEEIRRYADERTPEKLLLLLADQKNKIRQEFNRLHRMNDMMSLYTEMAQEGLAWNEDEIVIKYMKKEPIFLGPAADPLQSDEENSIAFYQYASQKGIELDYPLGCVISRNVLENGMNLPFPPNYVSRYYFKVKRGRNTYKPEGNYAIACGYCGYGQSQQVYLRLLEFIAEHGIRICGDAYEEFPLNEMAVRDDSKYFVKVAVAVETI